MRSDPERDAVRVRVRVARRYTLLGLDLSDFFGDFYTEQPPMRALFVSRPSFFSFFFWDVTIDDVLDDMLHRRDFSSFCVT